MFYFPRSGPRRESEWRNGTHPSLTTMKRSGTPTAATGEERVRVLPGISPDTYLVTGYRTDGTPVCRMEIPRRWLTEQWIVWMESRIAQEEGLTPVAPLKLLG